MNCRSLSFLTEPSPGSCQSWVGWSLKGTVSGKHKRFCPASSTSTFESFSISLIVHSSDMNIYVTLVLKKVDKIQYWLGCTTLQHPSSTVPFSPAGSSVLQTSVTFYPADGIGPQNDFIWSILDTSVLLLCKKKKRKSNIMISLFTFPFLHAFIPNKVGSVYALDSTEAEWYWTHNSYSRKSQLVLTTILKTQHFYPWWLAQMTGRTWAMVYTMWKWNAG